MPLNVNNLPNEILHRIFFELEKCQRLEIALVCQRWLSVLNCRTFLKGICLHIDRDNYYKIPAIIPTHSLTRMFEHIYFKDVRLDKTFLKFMQMNCDFIHALSFDCCRVHEMDFPRTESLSCLNKIKCLRILYFIEIIDLISSPLSSLEILEIKCDYLGDYHLEKLQHFTANLKSIYLNCNPVCDDPTVICQWEGIYVAISSPCVMSFITHHSTTLKEFFTHLTPSAAVKIASIPGLKLSSFCYPYGCDSSTLMEICRQQPCLTQLIAARVSFCSYRLVLEEVLQALPHLQDIVLIYYPNYTNLLLKLRNWKKLYIKCCAPNIEDMSVIRANSRFLMNLFLPRVKHVQELCLRGGCATDELMWLISATLADLKVLVVSDCAGLTDRGLTGMLADNESTSPTPCVPISNLKSLTQLSFQRVDNITGEGLVEAIQFPHLVVFLWECKVKTQEIQSELFKRNPCLKKCLIKEV